MKFEFLEVAGTHIFSMKAMTLVLFFIFAIIVVGYLVGKISIKGVSLGSAAIFLVALVAGHFTRALHFKTLPLGRKACRQSTTILSWCRIWGWFCL